MAVVLAAASLVTALAATPDGLLHGASIGVASAVLGGLVGMALARRRRATETTPAAAPRAPRSLEHEAMRLRLATEARDELEAFHYSVSHDLRSPFGAILNFTAVLAEDHGEALGAEGRAILSRVRHSAESGVALLDGLTRLSRVGRQELEPVLVEPEVLVREAFASEAVRDAARTRGVSVELRVDGPLPAVVADPGMLRTALAELLGNAVKASAGLSKPVIRVRGWIEPDGSACLEVADAGVGFDMRFAPRLFRVFERLHARQEFPGAGVGLAVVRRIAERHGGRVFAEGEPGRGARFALLLPDGVPSGRR